MTVERTAKVNALTALLRSVDLGVDARRPLTDAQITESSLWRARDEALAAATARAEAVRLAKRITILDAELKENQSRTSELLEATAPPRPCWRKPGSARSPPPWSTRLGRIWAGFVPRPRSPLSPG